MLTHQILTHVDISRDIDDMRALLNGNVDVSDEPLEKKGLQYLLMEEAYDDSFILHEPSEVEPYFKKMKNQPFTNYVELMNEIVDDPRKKLSSMWNRFFKFQPLNQIREYFGDQIAFYFAWQGTFLTFLWPATILGLVVFLFGFINSVRAESSIFNNCTVNVSVGSCDKNAHNLFASVIVWFMKSLDNELNAFFAAFMSIWGSLFYQIWRRNNSVLTYQWNCEDPNEVEPDRPEYIGSGTREDPVTGETVWFSPQIVRFFKMSISCFVVLLSMCVVVVSVLCVILYKIWIVSNLRCNQEYTFTCTLAATYVPSMLNTFSTMFLGMIYSYTVELLNNWENHRTQSEHNNALIIKLFAFQLVNNYTSLFYIAFIRPERNGFQVHGVFGLGENFKDVCLEKTCGSLLATQLITHMVIKPLPKFTKDIVIPYIIRLFRIHQWKNQNATLQNIVKDTDEMNVLLREWMKPKADDFTLGEFNEKIILFGTTMMFASLFPLAPLIALIIGLIDLRIDAHRLIWFNRRPVPVIASGIGIWLPILLFLQYAAVMTNAFIIAFTSDFCSNFFSDCDIKNRLLIVIVFQNLVFVLKYMFQSIIPTVPSAIRVAQRKKHYVISQIIEKGDVPHKIKNRKGAQTAKPAWLTSRKNLNLRFILSNISTFRKKKVDCTPVRSN